MEHIRSDYYGSNRSEMLAFIPLTAQKILEIGCGEGSFSKQLIAQGIECWGIEPDDASAERAASKLFKVIHAKLEDAIHQIPENYFDVIIFNDVLEHMLYPKDNLKLLKSKLSESGKIITSIPNFRYIKNLFQVAVKGEWEYTDSGILDYTHFRFFTQKSSKKLFEECGYKVEMIKGINPTKSIKYQLLAFIFSLLTLTNQFDTLYLQIALVAKINPEV
ncbi:MAG: class I SAM-dependent methyltransferase [Bacteroidota bacterium]|nr:class I SAM-dependent methyltransferase [Bacteroidota bacterium]